MKKIFVITLALVYSMTSVNVIAQEYEDLQVLWIDQKYEKLVAKAEKYTTNDKTKNDPLPYLYMCKALYRISQDEKLREKEQFVKAEGDALNYAVKYKKKDKSGAYKQEAETFFAEMKKTIFEQTENYYEAKDYKKVLAQMKKVAVFDDQNGSVWIIKGIAEMEMKNKPEALKNFTTGTELIKKISNFNDWYEVDQNFLRYTLMAYANWQTATKDYSGAKTTIGWGYQYFQKVVGDDGTPIPENQTYVDLYNKIVNGK